MRVVDYTSVGVWVFKDTVKFINEYGLEKVMYLVDFALAKVQESGYEPAKVAGIIQFTTKALEALAEEERINRIRERDAELVAERRKRDRWDTLQKKHQEEWVQRLYRYRERKRFKHKGWFHDWGDQGEFFELHWFLDAFQGTTVNLLDFGLNREVWAVIPHAQSRKVEKAA